MDKVSIVKSQVKLEHWRRLIAECQASGMQVKQWCIQNNVSKDQYYYWLRKVREISVECLPVSRNELPAKEHVDFKRLEVQAPVTAMTPAVIVHLPQVTIEIPEGISQQTVETVLLALRTVC